MTIYAKSATGGREEKESLAEHTIHDLQVADALVNNLPFIDSKKRKIGKDLRLAIAVHDVGKAAIGFQKSLECDAPYWGRRHEILSAVFASTLGLKEEIIFAVLTHHKTLPSNGIDAIYGCLPDEQIPFAPNHVWPVWNQMVEEWQENLTEFTEEWRRICMAIAREDLLLSKLSAVKLTSLSDDMGNNWIQRYNQAESIPFKQRHYASLLRGLLISADHIASSGSSMPVGIPVLNDYHITTNATTPQNLRGFQKRACEKKGNLILRAPTGSGKTLAAILWAKRNQKYNGRLFYALPTTASINAMYLRLKEYFGSDGNDGSNNNKDNVVGLLHSRVASYIYSILEDNGDPGSIQKSRSNQITARRVSSLAREMYYPIRVCTPHQILKYSLQGKGWELMLSEFPNSCFIFDEIHAYNPKLTGLTLATAKFLIKNDATCIFLSATLPNFLRKLIQHEIRGIGFIQPSYRNKNDRDLLNRKRHTLQPLINGNIISSIDLIAREAEKAESTLVVCNHVPTAQQVYRELNRKIDDIVLLHGQFCRRDRNKIENKLINKKEMENDKPPKKLPKILVATQVIEVSLDIDFERGFIEPAPIDAVVQRLGRINRYGEREPAKVWIFNEQQHSFKIYDEGLTDKSLKVLSSLPNPLGEEDLNQAADRVYGRGYSRDSQIEYVEGLNYFRLKKFKENLVAGTDQDWVDEIIDEKEGSVDLLPEQLVNEYNMLKDDKLKIEADNLLVPVGNWMIPYLIKKGSIDRSQDPWILMNCQYSSEIGLILERHL